MFYRYLPIFIIALFLLLLGSCSLLESEEDKQTECILEELQFDPFNSLKFQTISGGRIYRIVQQFTPEEGDVRIRGTYFFKYFPDKIVVTDQLDSISPFPFMTIELENDRPTTVTRYFTSSGVLLFHEFSYPEEDLIRIDMTREASTGDVLYVGYSLYHTGPDGNIVRNERFRAVEDDPSGFRKLEDRRYTYDGSNSPQKKLYLPFFGTSNFPDVRFFSENNILSFTEDNQTFEYSYQYGESNSPVIQTLPTGQTIQFRYINCPD